MNNNDVSDKNSDVQKTQIINNSATSYDKNPSNMSHKPNNPKNTKNTKSKKLKHILLTVLVIFLACLLYTSPSPRD